MGESITQSQLTDYINKVFHTNLVYNSVSVKEYTIERKKELGDFIGTIIAGIYEGIKNGANDVSSNYEKAAGRPHKTAIEIMKEWKEGQK